MVIVRLNGGLGNQMFQYACGRRVALVNGAPLKLDLSAFTEGSGRKYELHHFRISADIASPTDIERFKKSDVIKKILYRAGLSHMPTWECKVVRERFFHFDEEILSLHGDAYLEGYWQSERYFDDKREDIQQEFVFASEPDSENRRIEKEIQDTNAVSVHVRRGDYVSNPETNRVHGVCSLDYYREAVKHIVERVKEPHFFIFSDDPSWVKANLLLEHPVTYVTHNSGEKSYEDLRLMSFCKHHIIANSSFSWWGAWLAENPAKQVIAPGKWLNAEEHNTQDIIPIRWQRLDVA